MSNVLIRGMDMPATCVECYMCHYSICVITETECNARYSRRNDDCPLVEVKDGDTNVGTD